MERGRGRGREGERMRKEEARLRRCTDGTAKVILPISI